MVVLDASVILKWFIPEKDRESALRFRDAHAQAREQVIVPLLLFYEIANVIRYRKQLPDQELISVFDILNSLEITALPPSFAEIGEAALYARQKNISVYDAVYVVLAGRLGCNFITADKRLAVSVAEPFVKIIDEV